MTRKITNISDFVLFEGSNRPAGISPHSPDNALISATRTPIHRRIATEPAGVVHVSDTEYREGDLPQRIWLSIYAVLLQLKKWESSRAAIDNFFMEDLPTSLSGLVKMRTLLANGRIVYNFNHPSNIIRSAQLAQVALPRKELT